MLVVDASFVIDVCISARGFDPLVSHDLVAPPLLQSEATCGLHQLHWRDEITDHEAGIAFARLADAPISIHTPDTLYTSARDIAVAMGWAKTYDAEYVALAQILKCKVVTVDERLRRGTTRLGIVTTPNELVMPDKQGSD